MVSNNNPNIQLGTLQETMLIPLWARACEQQQEHPILKDRLSQSLMDQIDYHIDKKGVLNYLQVRLVVRSRYLDEYVRTFLEQHPHGSIIEIGCGLSTRFHRTDNGSAHWLCVDLEDAINFRKKLIRDHDRVTSIAGSIFEHNWIDQAKQNPAPYLIIVEGLLPYFYPDQVKQIFKLIADNFPSQQIAFDTQTELYRKLIKPGKLISANNGESGLEFHWTVKQPDEIQHMEPRLRLKDSKTLPDLPKKQFHRLTWKTRMMESASRLFWGRYRVSLFDIQKT